MPNIKTSDSDSAASEHWARLVMLICVYAVVSNQHYSVMYNDGWNQFGQEGYIFVGLFAS